MTANDNQKKLEQFHEFFTIEHQFSINVDRLDSSQIGDYQDFVDRIPAPFKMISNMASLDQAALRPLQALSGVAGQLVEYLNQQAQKIDLLMGYILSQQDDEALRFQGTSFGGGGITFTSKNSFTLNEIIELKIFIQTDNCSIYSFGEIIEIEEKDDMFEHKVIFHSIRDDDREILVRASLHKQSKQLQKLAQQRKQSQNS